MNKRTAGFTVTEMIVVVGIITVLASLIYPIASTMRLKAKKELCRANMTQLHTGLTMYSIDNNRLYEMYPAYLTNLCSVSEASYVNDERVFICPMDNSKATVNQYGTTALKPIYSITPKIPADDKHDWAERTNNGLGQRNCSYLYEFSGRICQTYTPSPYGGTWNDYSPSSFAEYYLVSAEDHWNWTTPWEIVRDGVLMADGTIGVTWQDAKFHQLSDGDIYITGYGYPPDDYPEPPTGFEDPSDWYWNNNIEPENYVTSYPRTWMPIVRCFYHQTLATIDSENFEQVLNLALDGNTFDSSPFWERTAFKYGTRVGSSTY